MHDLSLTLERLVREHEVPSGALCVMVDGEVVVDACTGLARTDPPRLARPGQPYDLASVTKSLVGASVAARLLTDGRISLSRPAADWLAGIDPRITVAQLLTHSSGLPAWRRLYEVVERPWGTDEARAQVIHTAITTPVEVEPGSRHRYSDLGFIALLAVLEAAGERRIDSLFADILRCTNITELGWGWPCAAATEHCPVRGYVIEGTVHDLNTAAMGGRSTHAGLFGTARAVARLGDAWRAAVADPTSSPLPGEAMARLWSLRGCGSHRGGWDSVTRGGYTSTGQYFPDDTVGHLGYTGTSLWVVPSRKTSIALLTNRVHPHDCSKGIRALRPALHDAVAQYLGWDTAAA